MHVLFSHVVLEILCWLIALPWIAKFAEAAWGLPRVADLLRTEKDRSPEGSPALTVIVPARNEAGGIAACLESLVRQDYARLRIIAVDDRSTDATGHIMDSIAAANYSRVSVIHIRELPEGWLGKPHAMAVAAQEAMAADEAPEYLLFTDGDIVFAPEILRRSLAEAEATGADHFVTLPTTITHTAGEAMLLSFLQVLGLFAVRPWRVADPGTGDALGVGAFNMIRAEAYQTIGGFEATPMEVLEDLALGRRVKKARLRQRVAYAPGAVAVHWAPGLVGVLHGMTKNLFAVFRFRPELLLAGAAGLTLMWIVPWVFLATPGLRLPGALALLALTGMYVLVSRRSLLSPWWAIAAPVAAGLLIYSMLRSMVVTLRDGGVTWRGTFYPLKALREKAAELR
ncbi:MAG: glycosyltransferase family 2 protein [Acidobacteriaceae bacterium]